MPGLKKSIWADAPRGYSYNTNRHDRWESPSQTAHEARTSSQPPPSSSAHPPPATNTSTPRPDTFHATTYRPPAPSHDIAPAQALTRLEQTCLRLRWKALDLEASYQRVLHLHALDPSERAHAVFTPQVAERNFKIDFYEFYAWIEQAIELFHRVFGVEVTSASWYASSGGYGHAFHHNVLRALGEESSPLFEVMGRGEVNAALWKAKELRNRWKEGGEDVPLGMYDLKWIVGKALDGLEGGYEKACQRVREEGNVNGSVDETANGNGNGTGREENWDWMLVDSAMDLDDDL